MEQNHPINLTKLIYWLEILRWAAPIAADRLHEKNNILVNFLFVTFDDRLRQGYTVSVKNKKAVPPPKICESCGRSFEYRKKWEKNWDSVKYCSDECRSNKKRFDYSSQILDLLAVRGFSKTICPSEVLAPADKQDPLLMEHVRRSARRLAAEGKIEITQQNKPVDPSDFKGPIRLKLK